MASNEQSSTPLAQHRFGGAWTEQKLEAVRYYLGFYTGALRKQPFDLWYVDAFAGSGERTETRLEGGLFEGTLAEFKNVQLDGSARRAMATMPPFKHLIFIEGDAKRFRALCKLRDEDPRVECLNGDANDVLREIFSRPAWRHSGPGKGSQRGVVFLDPYGMQVSWETLKMLAATKRVDVWYLFPLAATTRQLARNFEAIDSHKSAALTRVFGDENWATDLYEPSAEATLFDVPSGNKREATPEKIESYFKRRLETIFTHVSQPLPLFTDAGSQQFSLFFALSNDSPKAIQLAKNGMKDLLKQHSQQAFRRKSDH